MLARGRDERQRGARPSVLPAPSKDLNRGQRRAVE